MARGRRSVPGEFLAGAGMVWRGFRMWGVRPGLMVLGMLPAVIVFAVLAVLVGLLVANIETVTALITPFAEDWTEGGRELLRIFLGAALMIGAVVLGFYSFTALTLVVGDPFYERIWAAAEQHLGGFERRDLGFWRSAGDAAVLLLRSAGAGLLVAAAGFIPVVGQLLSPVLGVLVAGHILARELTTRPFEARGIGAAQRRGLRRGRRARELGFGVMTQLFYLVPGGAILVMPAAVVGAADLARVMLEPPAAGAPPQQRRDA